MLGSFGLALAASCLSTGFAAAAEPTGWSLSIGRSLSWGSVEELPGSHLGSRLARRWGTVHIFVAVDTWRLAVRGWKVRNTCSLSSLGVGLRWTPTSPHPRDLEPYLLAQPFTVLPFYASDDGQTEEQSSKLLDSTTQAMSLGLVLGLGLELRPVESIGLAAEVGGLAWYGHVKDEDRRDRGILIDSFGSALLTLYF